MWIWIPYALETQNSCQNQGNWIGSSLILCCFRISKHLKCIGLISLNDLLLYNNYAILKNLLSNYILCLLKTISTWNAFFFNEMDFTNQQLYFTPSLKFVLKRSILKCFGNDYSRKSKFKEIYMKSLFVVSIYPNS